MKVQDKVALDAIKAHKESHIEVNQEACRACDRRVCLAVCPAELYSLDEGSGLIKIEHAGCLECGTCLVVCEKGAITWRYPEPGFGIRYRHG
jgi:ferredoxin like protein